MLKRVLKLPFDRNADTLRAVCMLGREKKQPGVHVDYPQRLTTPLISETLSVLKLLSKIYKLGWE